MSVFYLIRNAVLALTISVAAPFVLGADFIAPLDLPARQSVLASLSLMQGVVDVDGRLVAVGQRGHIIYSDDQGGTWKQASVPVSSDLTAVYFVNAKAGWAVGQDGVIVHSQDGGASWVKQLDGRQANDLVVNALQRQIEAGDQSNRTQALLTEAIRNQEAGPDKPFLDVWFADENNGFVVGAYNLVFKTTDAGKHWVSWFDRTENPNLYHFNAIRGMGDRAYIVGEQGLFLRLDPARERFVAEPTPYRGSFFALAATTTGVTAFGMRGNVYRTADEGKSWNKVESGIESGLFGASVLDDGRLVAVSQAGQALISIDDGASFTLIPGIRPLPFTAVTSAGKNKIAISSARGVQIEQVP